MFDDRVGLRLRRVRFRLLRRFEADALRFSASLNPPAPALARTQILYHLVFCHVVVESPCVYDEDPLPFWSDHTPKPPKDSTARL